MADDGFHWSGASAASKSSNLVSPDFERLINIVHDAALSQHKRLCGPISWVNRPDFTCFQAGTEISAITRGVADELGPLKDTQGRPEVGPYAPKK